MNGVAEVRGVLGLGQPGCLTGGLAGTSAGSDRTVALTVAVSMVNIKKLTATQALTLSALRHDRSSTGLRNAATSATRTPTGEV
jgi:hypothetical protein